MKKGDIVYVARVYPKPETYNFKLREGVVVSVGKASFKVNTADFTVTFKQSMFVTDLTAKPFNLFCVDATEENKKQIETWLKQAKNEYDKKNYARLQELAKRKAELEEARTVYLQKYGKPDYVRLGEDKILFTKLFDLEEFFGHSFFLAITIVRYEQNFFSVETSSFTSFSSGPISQTVTPEHVFLEDDCDREELLLNAVVYLYQSRMRDAYYKCRDKTKKE